MSRVLISFVGGRPLPNIQVILHLKPDELYLVVSQDSKGRGGNHDKLTAALPGYLEYQPDENSHFVAPYMVQDTATKCNKIVAEHPSDEIILNVASEPTTMSFGAYQFAQEMKQKGQDVKLFYSSRDGLVDVFGQTSTPQRLKISIKDYFAVYGWNVEVKSDVKDDKLGVAKFLVKNLSTSRSLLEKMRSGNDIKSGQKQVSRKKALSDDEYKLLDPIREFGLLSSFEQTKSGFSFQMNQAEDWKFFKGDWLEIYVYDIARNLTRHNKPLFDECAWGIEEQTEGQRKGKGEIDFVGLYQGQLIIASCKTGDIDTKDFNELYTRGEQLGGKMCTKILITTIQRTTPDDKQQDERRAADREIVLVTAERLSQLGQILEKEALDPTYPRL